MKLLLSLALTTTLSFAIAQQAPRLTLETAITNALEKNAEVSSAQSALRQALETAKARNADPLAIITDILQADQAAESAGVNLRMARLEVANDTSAEFLNLSESNDTIEVLSNQTKLLEKNLEVAKARLANRTGTGLDVQRAETELAGSRQQLSDAKAQRPIVAARLSRLLGLERGVEPQIGDAPALRVRSIDLNALEQKLDERSPLVVRAAQNVEFAELIVKISDNDYTPDQNKREAQTNLENAKRALGSERRKALTQLRDVHRSLQATLEGASVAQKSAETAQKTLENDRVRLRNGLIARIQLDSSELAAARANADAARAANGYLRALTGLSLAAGIDVTGLVK
jgi:outer membrane protein